MSAEDRLKEGKPEEALQELQDKIRKDPSNPKHRVFLFQLLSVLGDWERAMTQLNVLADLDDSALMMVQTYRVALNCEALRREIYAGKHSPLIFGEPEEWLAKLVEALRVGAEGHGKQAQQLREAALESAPATAGTVNGAAFEWIADADSRMGPVLEAVVEGKLFWVPFHRIQKIEIEEPVDLRDLVWLPARFVWANGGQAVGLIPTRYPGSETSDDGLIRMGRKTEWDEVSENCFEGRGQRMFATDGGDYALLDLREVLLQTASDAAAGAPDG